MVVEILYVSAATSAREFDAMKAARRKDVQEVTYGMIESGQKFHTLIQAGLTSSSERNVTSLVGRSISSEFYRGTFWTRKREKPKTNLSIHHVSILNLPKLKQVWVAVGFLFRALDWRWSTRRASERVLIVDGAYVSALPSLIVALAGSKVTKIGIFCDVYAYMGATSDANRSSSGRYALIRRAVSALYTRLDSFVLLTEEMNALVNPSGKPHIVMEGIVDSSMALHENSLEAKDERPTVLYSGALRREYGLDWLVEGFRMYDNPEARLRIFGGGDFSKEIVEASKADTRIKFEGTAPVTDVVRAQERAWVLINPRPVDQEFTKFSFPSKVMEYLASGSPVLTTRLPGMPAEYLQYVSIIEESGPQAIRDALSSMLARSSTALHEMGRVGKEYVLSFKNDARQAERILALARSLRADD